MRGRERGVTTEAAGQRQREAEGAAQPALGVGEEARAQGQREAGAFKESMAHRHLNLAPQNPFARLTSRTVR